MTPQYSTNSTDGLSNHMTFERITDAADPNRCQTTNKVGQCINKGMKLEDGSYTANCLAHGGNKQVNSAVARSLKNYKLDRWKAKLAEKTGSDDIKGLREEIGILRVVLEERLNRCEDATDLILQSGPISDMVMKIERVVSSCHKLEGSMGQLLDKQAILQFAQVVISIVGEYVHEDVLPEVAEKIIENI
ncbi:hypothetical protein OAF54_03175 [bacterium]|nr:hypothetical protein [bacterium]